MAAQGHVHALVNHELLKVPQPGVNPHVTAALGIVHAVQLGQDHVEGLRQRGDAGDLPAVGAAALLHPEVRVDQQQRFHRQVVRLQIPDGVVGGHMADVGDAAAAEPQIGIVVVQVGHPLTGTAAELADIVTGGAAGHQRQIQRHAGPAQTAGGGHGHMVDAGDVLQRAVGRGLQPQTHQLVDVLPLPAAQHLAVAGGAGAAGQLLLRQEVERPRRVAGQQLLLRGEQHLQHRQEKHRPRAEGLGGVPLRVQQAAGKVVGTGQPTLLRLAPAAEGVQLRAAQIQYVGAAQPLPPEQRGKALHVVPGLQRPGKRLPVGQPVRRGAVGQAAAQGAVHLADAFFRHGDPSRIKGRTARVRPGRRLLLPVFYATGAGAVNISPAAILVCP